MDILVHFANVNDIEVWQLVGKMNEVFKKWKITDEPRYTWTQNEPYIKVDLDKNKAFETTVPFITVSGYKAEAVINDFQTYLGSKVAETQLKKALSQITGLAVLFL